MSKKKSENGDDQRKQKKTMQERMESVRKKNEKRGRKPELTQEYADYICDMIATHTESTRKLCDMYDDMPIIEVINQWRWRYPRFASQYAQAKMQQAELLAESLDDVANERNYYFDEKGNKKVDPGYTNAQRLVTDTRKWIASKLLPKTYGRQVEYDQALNENEQLKKELQALRAQLDEKNKSEY